MAMANATQSNAPRHRRQIIYKILAESSLHYGKKRKKEKT